MREVLEQLLAGKHLTAAQAADLLTALAKEDADPALIGGVLVALRAKGESADEMLGFAQAQRALARKPALNQGLVNHAVDIVGTGGDGMNTFNLSTGSALLAAACGVPVVKHGNRSISSRSGAADVLEALGLPMPLDEHQAAECLARTGFTFLFAPHYHPAVGALVAARRALGIRTVFNILGPLTDPAALPYGVIGACTREIAKGMADVFARMPIKRVLVINSDDGADEPTPVCAFTVFDATHGSVDSYQITPEEVGLRRCERTALRGGDATNNAAAIKRVFAGEQSPHRDALLLGAGLALAAAGKVESLRGGVNTADKAIDDGRAAALLFSLETLFPREAAAAVPAQAVGGKK